METKIGREKIRIGTVQFPRIIADWNNDVI